MQIWKACGSLFTHSYCSTKLQYLCVTVKVLLYIWNSGWKFKHKYIHIWSLAKETLACFWISLTVIIKIEGYLTTTYVDQIIHNFNSLLTSPRVYKNWHFTYYILFVKRPTWTFYWPSTPSSCPHSYWMTPSQQKFVIIS